MTQHPFVANFSTDVSNPLAQSCEWFTVKLFIGLFLWHKFTVNHIFLAKKHNHHRLDSRFADTCFCCSLLRYFGTSIRDHTQKSTFRPVIILSKNYAFCSVHEIPETSINVAPSSYSSGLLGPFSRRISSIEDHLLKCDQRFFWVSHISPPQNLTHFLHRVLPL